MTTRFSEFVEESPKLFLQSLFEESSVQRHPLGTTRTLSDGRAFIYVQAGAANIGVGLLCQSIADAANYANLAVPSNVAVGARDVTVTLGANAATANQFAEGFLYINNANGVGHSYKIRNHPAANASANMAVSLFDKIRVALLGGTTRASLNRHPCRGITTAIATVNARPLVGVTVIPLTANHFGWVQFRGPCPVLTDGTLVLGNTVFPSAGTAGAVRPSTGNATDMVLLQVPGRVLVVNATGQYSLIDLWI